MPKRLAKLKQQDGDVKPAAGCMLAVSVGTSIEGLLNLVMHHRTKHLAAPLSAELTSAADHLPHDGCSNMQFKCSPATSLPP